MSDIKPPWDLQIPDGDYTLAVHYSDIMTNEMSRWMLKAGAAALALKDPKDFDADELMGACIAAGVEVEPVFTDPGKITFRTKQDVALVLVDGKYRVYVREQE